MRYEGRVDNTDDYLRSEMLKFGSKNDVTVVHRATIRLLDDAEIIHCDFQVIKKIKKIEMYCLVSMINIISIKSIS